MINKKLRQLSAYIEDLTSQNPHDRFIHLIQMFEKKYQIDRPVQFRDNHDLFSDLDDLCKKYGQTRSHESILYGIYTYVEENLMKDMIYQKALDLDIDPTLFKKEMGFLFKGKPFD